jgi:hypothetical protein
MQAFKELCTWDNRNMCWLWWWNSARLRRPWWITTTSPLTTGNSPTSGFHVKDIYIQHGVIFMSKKLRNILIHTDHSFFDFMVTTLQVLCYFRVLLTRLLMTRVKESNIGISSRKQNNILKLLRNWIHYTSKTIFIFFYSLTCASRALVSICLLLIYW